MTERERRATILKLGINLDTRYVHLPIARPDMLAQDCDTIFEGEFSQRLAVEVYDVEYDVARVKTAFGIKFSSFFHVTACEGDARRGIIWRRLSLRRKLEGEEGQSETRR